MTLILQLLLNTLVVGACYALTALGYVLIYRTVKFFDFSYGSLITLGGYLFYALHVLGQIPALLSAIGSIVGVACMGCALDALIYRTLRQRHASPMTLLVSSLGVATLFQAVFALLFGTQFQTISMEALPRIPLVGEVTITSVQMIILLAAATAIPTILIVLRKTSFGMRLRAIADDEGLARTVGLPVERLQRQVCLVSSAMAGLVGILMTMEFGVDPAMGFSVFIRGFVAVVLGGFGSLGSVLAGLFLAGVENAAVWQFSGQWRDVVVYALLIGVLVVRSRRGQRT